ncbi:MAG: hypothetical protein P4L51_24940 [Puia sp.]|nr:hypothetical protein [Puia sp.]
MKNKNRNSLLGKAGLPAAGIASCFVALSFSFISPSRSVSPSASVDPSLSQGDPAPANPPGDRKHPRIINIINFIRLLEPRVDRITEDVLYQTVVSQVKMMDQYKLGGTFLLQYDALMDTRYQQLFKTHPGRTLEVGAWWEIVQPLVEKAGLAWRGRYPWDWDAKVDFSSGYSEADREKLVDAYMKDFKSIYGDYPKSVGSWFIDAYTLNYMYRKYGIVASCNCKDQIGTDGYTLWGGYWNQAYYPSVKNAYMPAQTEENQIPVPIFRMLGSDPVRQYDDGVGANSQGVVTLEPVYKYGGGDADWVHWYFRQFVEGASMGYAYAQAGQENSFTWEKMSKGFSIQLPLIAKLRDAEKIRVETLEESGKWFRQNYKVTPPTSVTVNEDLAGSDKKTVWFNSRFFRLNLLWDKNTLRFRDIHLFREGFSDGLPKEGATGPCSFYTLPFMDGHIWSNAKSLGGVRLKALVAGKELDIEGGAPIIGDEVPGHLHISWPLNSFAGKLVMDIDEGAIHIGMEGAAGIRWWLDFAAAGGADLPFVKIDERRVDCRFQGLDYHVRAAKGVFSKPDAGTAGEETHGGATTIFRVYPTNNAISLHFSE